MDKRAVLAALFAVRHGLGGLLGALAAWPLAIQGIEAYAPIAHHGECGFLCMNLLVAGFWGGVAAGAAVCIWVVVALSIRALCKEVDQGPGG
ncbi:hypothetical protein [Roseateles sp. DXS20W]|uniref:hypothetical protein n=1 Tax=Pelomonas lactea TaxID=3299030 RepID=UPI00374A6E52